LKLLDRLNNLEVREMWTFLGLISFILLIILGLANDQLVTALALSSGFPVAGCIVHLLGIPDEQVFEASYQYVEVPMLPEFEFSEAWEPCVLVRGVVDLEMDDTLHDSYYYGV